MTDPVDGFKRVLDALNRLNIPYMVGGSLASSIYGVARSTADVDLVADVRMEHVDPLSAELAGEFYAEAEMMRQALRTGRVFNLIHFASSYKFDIYPVASEPYHQAAFARRRLKKYPLEGQELTFYVASAEDTILAKLAWYRSGNEVSERQWSDVLDVVRVQWGRLELAYLREWASSLGVADLLEQALGSVSS